MAAHWRSRLRIGHGKGVREQGTEPGTLVTDQVSGATVAPRPRRRKPIGFIPLGGPRGPWALPHGRGSESIPGRTDDRRILGERALQITRTLATKHQRAAREPEIG